MRVRYESSPHANISDREAKRREESCERSERYIDDDAPFVFSFLCHSCVCVYYPKVLLRNSFRDMCVCTFAIPSSLHFYVLRFYIFHFLGNSNSLIPKKVAHSTKSWATRMSTDPSMTPGGGRKSEVAANRRAATKLMKASLVFILYPLPFIGEKEVRPPRHPLCRIRSHPPD